MNYPLPNSDETHCQWRCKKKKKEKKERGAEKRLTCADMPMGMNASKEKCRQYVWINGWGRNAWLNKSN